MAEEMKSKEKGPENVIFVGKKPNMSYVLAAVTQFTHGQKEIHIKARGQSISKAVDVAEIVRNKFVTDAKITKITTGTEQLKGSEGSSKEFVGVSTIEITMSK